MASQNVHFTRVSSNAKTGPIPVTTSPANTCPDACPLKEGGGCYAANFPLSLHWGKVTAGDRGEDLATLCDNVRHMPRGQLWRHNQAGDLAGNNNRINSKQLQQLARANKGRRGFTYTHKPMTPANLAAVKQAHASGFTISLSANNPAHADTLARHGLPVVTIAAADLKAKLSFTPAGRKMVTCPAAIDDTGRMNCARCGMCAIADRDYIIAFPAHGAATKKVTAACKLQAA